MPRNLSFVALFVILTPAILFAVFEFPMRAAARAVGAMPPKCDTPAHHEFDFWIGDWTVADLDGKAQGTNRVESILGGCAIQEHWKGIDGSDGTSINAFLKLSQRWHQSWISDDGGLLLLDGRFADGQMVLEGTRMGPKGVVTHRITWKPIDADHVRQTWVMAPQGTTAWTTVFDGIYTRVKA